VLPTKVKILVAGSVLDAPGDDIAKHNTCASFLSEKACILEIVYHASAFTPEAITRLCFYNTFVHTAFIDNTTNI
jgi:hypothetical protein